MYSQQSSVLAINSDCMIHASGVEIAPHSHDYGQLIVVLRGTARILDQYGWRLATPRMAIWIPPGIRHQARYTETSELIRIAFDGNDIVLMPTLCAMILMSTLALELARESVSLTKQENHILLPLVGKLLLHQLPVRQVSSELFVAEGHDKRLRQITQLLRECPDNQESLAMLAKRSACSERTLSRLFERETGLSFTKWRERLRIISAIERLAKGDSLTQVALSVGYQNASSFSTAFSRLMGVPPGLYLQRIRE